MREPGTEPDAQHLAEATEELARAGEALRTLTLQARADAIAEAASRLGDPSAELGKALRLELTASTGLSGPVIEWGLTTTLGRFTREELLALCAGRPSVRRVGDLAAVVLAGNVFSAAARPLLLPLLCGVPCAAKASSRDAALPRAIARAFAAVRPELFAALRVFVWSRAKPGAAQQLEREAALFARASVVSVYGSDETIAELAPLVPTGALYVPRGHGFGLALVEPGSEAHDRAAAEALALDLCAYDQRGCLSPQAVFVLDPPAATDDAAERFALQLVAALERLEPSFPRGSSPPEAAAAQHAWRAVAAARGELYARPGFAVSLEGSAPLRGSCGHRHIGVYRCKDLLAFEGQARRLAPHLKAIGASPSLLPSLEALGLAPYLCPLGQMQDPLLSAPLDGLHPLHGLG